MRASLLLALLAACAASVPAAVDAAVQDAPAPPTPQEEAQPDIAERAFWRGVEVLSRDLPLPFAFDPIYGPPPFPNARGLEMPFDEDHDGRIDYVLIFVLPVPGDPNEVLDVLMHEWAHALLAGTPKADVHGELWGVVYSRVYRAMMAAAARGEFKDL